MLKDIQKLLQDLMDKAHDRPKNLRLPKAAPSAEEAIVPFNPNDYIIQPATLKRMMIEDRDFVLLDVREEWEFQISRLPKAKLIPLRELPQRVSELNPYDEIVIYCHHGVRSLDAAYLLQQIGFKRISSLIGGIDRWSREIDLSIDRY